MSIIMSMRDSAATVATAIRSIQLQTLENWELIVIDDGSVDQSVAIVGAIKDPRIHLVKEPYSAGLATRLNQAVAMTRGEFIARMDADDVSFPDRLTLQINNLKRNSSIDVLGCGAVVFADNITLIGTLPIELTHEQIVANPFSGFPFPHPTWCGRAEWFRANPYDEALMKAQDQDLLLRVFERSHFAALADVLVGYRQDVVNLNKRLQGRRVFIRSLWRYARKSSKPLPALCGIGTQLVKSVLEIVTIAFGLNRLAQRRRLKPVPTTVACRWLELQKQLESRIDE